MSDYRKGEFLEQDLKTKKVYFYVDEEEDLKTKSREVYKGKALEIQYPFNKDGSQKYKYIESIEFKNISPQIIKGVYKSVNFGLGFTKNLSPIVYKLEEFPQIKKIVISNKEATSFKRNSIIFNTSDLERIFNTIKPLREVHSSEVKLMSHNLLAELFPSKLSEKDRGYIKGELSTFIAKHKIDEGSLSEGDIASVISLIPDKIQTDKLLFQAEEKINFIKLNKAKENFHKLINQKTDTKTLEEKCQSFFTKNSWILSNILSIPIAILKGKAYVGGKDYTDSGGRVTDFLYKNDLTKNVVLIEIKTPLKKLIDTSRPYRKPDVYSLGKEVTGGLVQVLDQKDNLQREFYKLSQGKFEAFNPKAILIVGNSKNLKEDQLKSFELFRSNIKDVEIVTFDELLERTEMIFGNFSE